MQLVKWCQYKLYVSGLVGQVTSLKQILETDQYKQRYGAGESSVDRQ